jgi:hypothetical protein
MRLNSPATFLKERPSLLLSAPRNGRRDGPKACTACIPPAAGTGMRQGHLRPPMALTTHRRHVITLPETIRPVSSRDRAAPFGCAKTSGRLLEFVQELGTMC